VLLSSDSCCIYSELSELRKYEAAEDGFLWSVMGVPLTVLGHCMLGGRNVAALCKAAVRLPYCEHV